MEKALSYEELVERFREKVASIPEECYDAIMYWQMAKEAQSVRIAGENNLRQAVDVSAKVFYADSDIPEQIRAALMKTDKVHLSALRSQEGFFTRRGDDLMKATRWFKEVASPAAEGVGMGLMIAGGLLWTIGSAKRFSTFGKIVRYAGLDVREGKAPKRQKGQRVTWNPELRTTLFKLTEVWNREPDSVWRARWDGWKVWYAENRPEILEEKGGKGHIHNMARRKIQREFLRNLWTLWSEFEDS